MRTSSMPPCPRLVAAPAHSARPMTYPPLAFQPPVAAVVLCAAPLTCSIIRPVAASETPARSVYCPRAEATFEIARIALDPSSAVVRENAQRLSGGDVVEEGAPGPGAILPASGGGLSRVGTLLGRKGALRRTFGGDGG
jgi:hypothetical protein